MKQILLIINMAIEPTFTPTLPLGSNSKIFINGIQTVTADTPWLTHFNSDYTHNNSKVSDIDRSVKIKSGGSPLALGSGTLNCGALTIATEMKILTM